MSTPPFFPRISSTWVSEALNQHRGCRQPPRRLPLALRRETDKAITEMLQQDVIEASSSPWSAPIVLVRKKDGSIRFCIDYRKLNVVTHNDSYPLPRIDDTLETLAGAEWFSSMHLKSKLNWLKGTERRPLSGSSK